MSFAPSRLASLRLTCMHAPPTPLPLLYARTVSTLEPQCDHTTAAHSASFDTRRTHFSLIHPSLPTSPPPPPNQHFPATVCVNALDFLLPHCLPPSTKYPHDDTHTREQFMGAAVVEVLLSTDNICLFHQIFEHFKVPREVRPGLLFVGTPFLVLIRGGGWGQCTRLRVFIRSTCRK